MTGLEIAALIALIAGTGLQVNASNRQASAQAQAQRNLASKLDARSAEAQQYLQEALRDQNVDKQQAVTDDQTQQKIDRVETLFQEQPAEYDPIVQGNERAPTVVREQAAKDMASQLTRARAQIAAKARLEGFSGRTFDRGLQLQGYQPKLQNLGLFASGDQNVADAESYAAGFAGKDQGMLGDLLVGLGGMGIGGIGQAGKIGVGVKSATQAVNTTRSPLYRSNLQGGASRLFG